MKILNNLAKLFCFKAEPPEELPLRDALRHLIDENLDAVVADVRQILENMGLRLPERDAMLAGAEGALIFLDDEGVVLRFEKPYFPLGRRIDDHPMVLQPLLRRTVGEGLDIEIVPGCRPNLSDDVARQLGRDLKTSGVHFHDAQTINTGLLPIVTAEFPQGLPVVIDRLAVGALTQAVAPIQTALDLQGRKQDAQQELYADLRQRFERAWPEGQKLPDAVAMADVWGQCHQKKSAGVLIAGWQDIAPSQEHKAGMAAAAGQKYKQQLKAATFSA